MKVRSIIISGNGTNCEKESAAALNMAGADSTDIITIWELLEGKASISDYNFLCLPGGFADGDNLGSAKAMAHRLTHGKPGAGKPPFREQLDTFINNGGIIVGICNGFQLLVKMGLLPFPQSGQTVTLTHNLSGRFEARWVKCRVEEKSPCIFTRGIDIIDLPIRHGEGRLLFGDEEIKSRIESEYLIPLRYIHPETLISTEEYPYNPNGSFFGAAGLCDASGRIFGLMPHPEAFNHRTNHPQWTRINLPEEGLGIRFFRNGVEYLKKNF
ncbi:phosphoribosylformylglycinamidine synthase subunit PurQ [Myxococcota bacterium]|nr:phosphoribosylformylglycinamidine synthase subunit PurQ [Myxococcota bacterium]MBU1379206.1 phosphoribosylformylglycinamidine synthase subunit PurQ [Myxococcota bacterium]MBU1496223.1 phosphoribosylformylglycinamidine synthase subunit PurQ [Myxococcota bacterium]